MAWAEVAELEGRLGWSREARKVPTDGLCTLGMLEVEDGPDSEPLWIRLMPTDFGATDVSDEEAALDAG